MSVLKGIARASCSKPPRVWLATSGAVTVDRGERPRAAGAAALWGLARVMGAEHPDLWGGAVDVDGVPPEAAAGILWRETGNGGTGEEVAWRGGDRYVARLARSEGRERTGACRVRSDATYLVTGGLGALGFEVCRWLVARGARRFLLFNRTPLPPRGRWSEAHPAAVADRIGKVRALESLGATVHAEAVDVGDRQALGAAIRRFVREGWPAIRGVVHAAGVVRDGLIRDLEGPSWKDVFAGKVGGACALREELGGTPIDFLVLFSSLGSVLGQEGQGSYGAANSVLDAIARQERSAGRNAVSLSWGPWKGLGFAETAGGSHVIARLADQGIGTLTVAQALGALEWALASGAAHALVAPVDWRQLGDSVARGRSVPLLSGLVPKDVPAPGAAPGAAGQASVRDRVEAAPGGERAAILEQAIRERLSLVLKIAAEKIDGRKPFGAMGLTSLLGLEFRNRLEKALGISLPATLVWNYPTVPALARNLVERLGLGAGEDAGRGEPAGAAEPLDAADALAGLESLSESDAIDALRKGRPGR